MGKLALEIGCKVDEHLVAWFPLGASFKLLATKD